MIASMVAIPALFAGMARAVLGPDSAREVAALTVLVQDACMLAGALVRLRSFGVRWQDLGPFAGSFEEAGRGVAWGGGLLILNAVAGQLAVALFSGAFGEAWVEATLEREQAVVSRLLDSGQGTLHLAWTVFMAVGVAPLVEEIFFRGYAYPALKFHAGRHAQWLSGVLFASVHMYVINFVPLFVLGVALAWLYERTRRLAVPVLAHAVMNCLVAIIVVWASANLSN